MLNLTGKHFEIDESDSMFDIDKIHPRSDEWYELYSKSLLMLEGYAEFWEPLIEVGKKCMAVMKRDIFTSSQRSELRSKRITPVENQELKKTINSLSFQIKQSVQSSNVTTEDDNPPPSAAKPEVVNVVLESEKNRMLIERLLGWARRDGLITGFPQWLWYELGLGSDGISEQMFASHPFWSTVLPTPYFERPDSWDIKDNIRLAFKSKAELLEEFPHREDALKEFESALSDDEGLYNQRLLLENNETGNTRGDIITRLMLTTAFENMHGYYLVAERNFPIKKKQTIYYNEGTKDAVMIPKNWSAARKKQWVLSHPEHRLVIRKDVKTLWTTTIDVGGFIWENDESWFQHNGELPGTAYVPDMIDGVPVGVGEDQLPHILAIAMSETMGLQQVKVGGGTYTFSIGGVFENPESIGYEMEQPNGSIILKKKEVGNRNMDQVVKTFQRKPNTTYFDYGDRQRTLAKETHSVNDAITGASHPRQSAVSKEIEITQGMTPQSEYVNNYSYFVLNNTQKLLHFIPYVMTTQKVVRINDEFGQNEESVQVNITQYDYSGQAQIVANDLTIIPYTMVPVRAEDSGTSRERQLQQFINMVQAVGNQLFQLNPRLMAHIFSTLHNRYAKEAGAFLMQTADQLEQAQAQAAQAEQQKEERVEKRRRDVDWAKIFTPDLKLGMKPQDMQDAPLAAQIMFSAYNQSKAQAAAMAQPGVQQQNQGVNQ